MARGAELAGVALAAEHGEQVFEGVAEAFGVVVGEAVDFLEEGAQRFRVAVGQVGVLEDVAEERGDAGVFVHPADGVGVEVELVLAGEFGRFQPRPAVAGEVAGEEAALAAEVFGLAVHVVHELVDERDGDLFDLRFGVRHLADEDVAAGVDTALGFGVEHLRGVLSDKCGAKRSVTPANAGVQCWPPGSAFPSVRFRLAPE